MEHNEWRLPHGQGGVVYLTSSHARTLTLDIDSGYRRPFARGSSLVPGPKPGVYSH